VLASVAGHRAGNLRVGLYPADLVRGLREVRWLRCRTGGSITTDEGETVTVLGTATDPITR
jgi:hypothetical protein